VPSPDNAPAVTTAATRPGTAGGADLILRNGRIFTGDPARPQATALAVSGGRLTAVGDEADVAALRACLRRRVMVAVLICPSGSCRRR
jgi:hypothetical protein